MATLNYIKRGVTSSENAPEAEKKEEIRKISFIKRPDSNTAAPTTAVKPASQIEEEARRRNYAAEMQQQSHENAALRQLAEETVNDRFSHSSGKFDEEVDTSNNPTYASMLRGFAYGSNSMSEDERDRAALALSDEKKNLPTLGERISKIASGAGKQYLGADVNAAATAYEAGDNVRNEYYSMATEADRNSLEMAIQRRDYMAEHIADGMFTQADVDAEQTIIDSLNLRLGAYNTGRNSQQITVEKAQKLSDELSNSGASDIERASEGLGAIGSTLVQGGAAALQMGADVATGTLLGSGSMLPMMVRSFGGGAQEARSKGYNAKQQIALGLTSAATEYFTEKLFGGNPAYDTDIGLVNKLVSKITSNEAVINALSSVPAEMISEGLEEVISDLLNPVAEWAITGTRPEYELDEIIQDGAVGVLLGVVGQAGERAKNMAFGSGAESNHIQETSAIDMALEMLEQQAAQQATAPAGNPLPAPAERAIMEENTTAEKAPAETQKTASTEETVVNDNPAEHTPEEQRIIEEYKDSVDPDLVDFYNQSKESDVAEKTAKAPGYELNPVNDRMKADIQKYTGIDTSGWKTVLDVRQANHIYRDHGPNGHANHSMENSEDVGRMQYVLDNYDLAVDFGTTDAYWEPKENGKNRQAKTVAFMKKVNGTYFIVEAVPNTAAKTINVVTAFMADKGKLPYGNLGKKVAEALTQLTDATNAPQRYGQTATVRSSPAENSVAQPVQESQAESISERNRETIKEFTAGDDFGSVGKVTLSEMFNDGDNVSDYLGDMTRYYNAVKASVNNPDVDMLSVPGNGSLNAAQADAAPKQSSSAAKNNPSANRKANEIGLPVVETSLEPFGGTAGIVWNDESVLSKTDKEYQFKTIDAAVVGNEVYFRFRGAPKGSSRKYAYAVIRDFKQYTANEVLSDIAQRSKDSGTYPLGRHFEDLVREIWKQNGLSQGFATKMTREVTTKEESNNYGSVDRGSEVSGRIGAVGRAVQGAAGKNDAALSAQKTEVNINGRQEAGAAGDNGTGTGSVGIQSQRSAVEAGRVDEGAAAIGAGNSVGAEAERAGGDRPQTRTDAKDREVNTKVTLDGVADASSFGIEGGDTTQKVRLVESGSTQSMQTAEKIAAKSGYRITPFVGGYLGVGDNHFIQAANMPNDDIIAAADDPEFTIDRLAGHEVCEGEIRKGNVSVKDAIRSVRDQVGDEKVDRVLNTYKSLHYDGKELVCDAAGNMNRLAAYAEGNDFLTGLKNDIDDVISVLHDYVNYDGAYDDVPALEGYSGQGKTEFSTSSEGYSGLKVIWAVDSGVISENERIAFFKMIANINKLGEKVRRTSYGGYIIELNNKLLFTDGDWKSPSLSSVIVFHDNSETSMRIAKDVIFNGKHNSAGYEESRQIIENAYWPGYVERYTERNAFSYGGENARGERTNGEGTSDENETGRVEFSMAAPVEETQKLLALNSRGEELTQQQTDFFHNSKMRDDQGRLQVMYRGGNDDFTVFDRRKSRGSNLYGRGFYFTADERTAQTYGNVRAFYLNIENPLSPGQNKITKAQMLAFLKAVADEEDYGLENYGYGATVESVLRDIYGKGDFEMLQDVNATAVGDLVAAVELFNDVNGTDYDGIILPTETVTFRSNQAKNIDNDTPTDNQDIRYSSASGTEELKTLQAENERLQKQVDELKVQMKTTDRSVAQFRSGDLKKAARELIKSNTSTMETEDVVKKLEPIYKFIAEGGADGDELTYHALMDRVAPLAKEIADSAEVMKSYDIDSYHALKNYLKGTKLAISQADRADVNNGDYEGFRKSMFGKMTIGTTGTPVDVAYMELQEIMGVGYFPEDITHPAEQLERIAEVFESVRPAAENPYSLDMAEATNYIANEIIDGYFSVRETPDTFADRAKADKAAALARQKENLTANYEDRMTKQEADYEAKLARQKAQMQAAKESALERAAKQRDAALKKTKQHFKEVNEARRERKTDAADRVKLLKVAKRLKNIKTTAANRALLNELLKNLDTVSVSMTGKTIDKLSDLLVWYQNKAQTDPDFIRDPGVEAKISRLAQHQIKDMNIEQVRELTDVLRGIENGIRNQGRMISVINGKTVYRYGERDAYMMGLDTINDVNNSTGTKKNLADWFATNELTPERLIHRITGYNDNDPLYLATKALSEGQRIMLDYQRRAQKMFQRFMDDRKFMDSVRGKKAEKIEVYGVKDGQTVKATINPDMRMSLYLHSLNDQNLRHAATGGVTIPDAELLAKGKVAEAYARGVTIKMTPSNIRKIAEGMSAKERAYAEAAHKYFNTMAPDEINAVSEALVGWSIAGVENYFPINTDSRFSRREFETLRTDGTIEGMGFLKERVDAANPMMLRGLTDVLNQSIGMNSKYVGLAVPVRNFDMLWNTTRTSVNEKGEKERFAGSVQEAIEKKWGTRATSYVEKLMTDVQSAGQPSEELDEVFGKLRSNYAGAVLSLNASVAIKQAASYPTAAAVLGWGPIIKAMKYMGPVDLELINKYTPMLWYRSLGYSTQELGDVVSRKDSVMNRIMSTKVTIKGRDFVPLNWIQAVDLLTVRKLWKASEIYVQQHNKELSLGSEEYYKAVAEIYNRVIEETQPNYTTMQRPQILRSNSTLTQATVTFKTQPFQNYNIIYDAMADMGAKKRAWKNSGTEESRKAYEQAKKNAANAVSSQIVSAVVFSTMTAVASLVMRRFKKRYSDDDGEVTTGSFFTKFAKDLVGNFAGMFVGGTEALDLANSLIFRDPYYGPDAINISAASDAAAAVANLGKYIASTAGEVFDWKDVDLNKMRIKLTAAAEDISKIFGLPVENVNGMVEATVKTAAEKIGGKYYGEYVYLLLTEDKSTKPGDFHKNLYDAYRNDTTAYEALYDQMVADGFDENKIKSYIEGRMKEEQGVESVNDLENRYLSPSQKAAYDQAERRLKSSGNAYGMLKGEQRDTVDGYIYDYAVGNSGWEKIVEKFDGYTDVGLDALDLLVFLNCRVYQDEKNDSGKYGTYTNDEIAYAIRTMAGPDGNKLTKEQKDFLWVASGKNPEKIPKW